MKLLFSTISEIIDSFKSIQPIDAKMKELLIFTENKLQPIDENSSLGFFKSKNLYEKLDEKIMNIFLENKKEISPEELKTLTSYIATQNQNNQTQKKFYLQFIISITILGISTYFILNGTEDLKKFGFSTLGIVIGYWLK
jgi:hypothetical protein